MKDIPLQDLSNSIRILSAEAIETSKSGHPGLPLGFADVATVLFTKFLKFNPMDPLWINRDRFILSAGHGSMLLYSLLYLLGYEDMSLDELKNFRKLHRKTAGHPEFGHAGGIETTTGPLGQGLANAVGMAISEAHLHAKYKGAVDHRTVAVVGDGCLMEGISQEAITFAAHQKLGKLIVLFDDNGITIDGKTTLSTSENQIERFKAAGWRTFSADGHDFSDIESTLGKAFEDSEKPTFVAFKTKIGFGASSVEGTSKAHGSPLGAEEIQKMRQRFAFEGAAFSLPDQVRQKWQDIGKQSLPIYNKWKEATSPSILEEIKAPLPNTGLKVLKTERDALLNADIEEATRKSSERALNIISPEFPSLMGGSADLTGSNNTLPKTMKSFTPENRQGNYIYYGIREHAMGAIMNGMAASGSVIPYGGTFLTFSDYCRPAIRLSALMSLRVIYVLTHDSIGLGEDGPTHQPIEHLMSLRAIPNLNVFRPADVIETLLCWELALKESNTPSVLALSRQNLPQLWRVPPENSKAKGAYVLEEDTSADLTIIATGSEVSIAMKVRDRLLSHGIKTRIVSMPCWELFLKEPQDIQEKILGAAPRASIEAGIRMGWEKFVTDPNLIFGIDTFGASAPGKDLYEYFGLTPEEIAKKILKNL